MTASELDGRIARQSLRIEQVRLHLQELSTETFDFGRACRWLERMIVELAMLRVVKCDLYPPSEMASVH